ncbi:MAG TPA: DUF2799 domain-containing protein [Burkholderiales bacterium]|nr:DUF2799 domain-containing protein [Burkholderiales bacterium]
MPTAFKVILVSGVFIAGCASLSKNQCLNADWYTVGLEDGAVGRPLERLGDHRRACAEYNVAPQTERYVAGRNEGLRTFCTYERGYSNGRSGQGYTPVCAAETGFGTGYQRGREIFDLTHRLEQIQHEITRTKEALKAGIPNPAARAREVERLEDLTREAEQLESRLKGVN